MENDLDLQVLDPCDIQKKLKKLPGWKYVNNKITKEYQFPSFADAVALVNKLAPFCDRLDHHPDIHVYYKKIVFDLQRFSVGGKVTERDFTVAKEIERLKRDGFFDNV